jgi:hypothetical protein
MTTTVMQEVWNAWTECETASDVVFELQTMDGRRKISNTVCK